MNEVLGAQGVDPNAVEPVEFGAAELLFDLGGDFVEGGDARGLPFDDFALLSHSVQLELPGARPLFRERRLLTLPYASLRWYADPPATPLSANGQRGGRTARLQAELGVTFDTIAPLRIGRVKLPAIGVGYRFGDNLSVFRIVIGEPF